MAYQTAISLEDVFGTTPIGWGRKFPRDEPLLNVWKKDRDYLLWACNLGSRSGRGCDSPPPALQRSLIEIAYELTEGDPKKAIDELESVRQWYALTQEGAGLELLPQPSKKECKEMLSKATVLVGHGDLDGIYSMASAIARGGALKSVGKKIFNALLIFNFYPYSLERYTDSLAAEETDSIVIIDYAAHPLATLTLDHHATALSFFDVTMPLPTGIFDTTYPSCPHLLADKCGLDIPTDVIEGCDLVDGAQYRDVDQTVDLDNPFVALETALSIDTTEMIKRSVVLTLAENDLDPFSVLDDPLWQARIALASLEMEQQRTYWSNPNRYTSLSDFITIADGRRAPYHASRFRFLAFSNPDTLERPFLVTLRETSSPKKVSIGLARNPFFKDKDFFERTKINCGAIAANLGDGGGRKEAASFSVPSEQLSEICEKIAGTIDDSIDCTNTTD